MWDPLLAIAGSGVMFEQLHQGATGELAIMRFLVADRDNPASIALSISAPARTCAPLAR